MEETNFDEIAKRELAKKEQQEAKVTSFGLANGYTEDPDEPSILPGYHEIWVENFPTKGKFYPKNLRMFIRAAGVKEIRQWSTVNDEDPFSIDEGLTDILKGCVLLRLPGKQLSFKDIKEEDRFHIILSIKDLTFAKGENKLIIPAICQECKHENKLEVSNKSFTYKEEDERLASKYNPESRLYEFVMKNTGKHISLGAPSIGVVMEISKYIRKCRETQKDIDASFIKVLPYLVNDRRGFTEAKIKELELEFMKIDSETYQIYNGLIELVRVSVDEQVHMECEKCGAEVHTKIQFPNGIKSLFVVSDIFGQLL